MKDYYKIGEIAKLYDIGSDSLRYYEELGILNPKRSDNGYRMYGLQDIWKLNIIKDLRKLNFSLQKIKNYLDHRTLTSTLELLKEEDGLIEKKIQELEKSRESLQRRIADIELGLEQKDSENIKTIYLEARKTLKLNGNVSRDEEIDFLIKKLHQKSEENLYILGNNHVGALIGMENIRKEKYNLYNAVFFILDNEAPNYDFLLPEGWYASYCYRGEYKRSKTLIPEMLAYIQQQGYEPSSEVIEIYHLDIHETSIKEEFLTEIQILIKK